MGGPVGWRGPGIQRNGGDWSPGRWPRAPRSSTSTPHTDVQRDPGQDGRYVRYRIPYIHRAPMNAHAGPRDPRPRSLSHTPSTQTHSHHCLLQALGAQGVPLWSLRPGHSPWDRATQPGVWVPASPRTRPAPPSSPGARGLWAGQRQSSVGTPVPPGVWPPRPLGCPPSPVHSALSPSPREQASGPRGEAHRPAWVPRTGLGSGGP